MEEYVHALLSLIVLSILYKRMIDREVPSPIGWLQALLPVGLGGVSLPLSFSFFLAVSTAIVKFDLTSFPLPPFLKSVRAGFFMAGLPEETAKLIAILVSLLFLHKKVRNLYEYLLIGIGVGFGFTVFEEFLYGSNLMRLPLLAMHGIYSGIMSYHLGLSVYHKKTQQGPVAIHVILALVLPMLMHSLYDACTAFNTMLFAEGELVDTGIMVGIAGVAITFVVQVWILLKIKKDAEKLCSISFQPQTTTDSPAA